MDEFLADLFDPNVATVIDTGAEEGAAGFLAEFLALALAAVDDAQPPAPPKRDSAEYAQAIATVAHMDDLERVIGALRLLWNDYGWRGPIDVMSEWIAQIETAPLTRDSRFRDLVGAVDLRTLIVIEATEEQRLRMAADKQQKLQQEGLAPHLALQQGLAETEAGINLTKRWLPYLHAALVAAHTSRDRRAIAAELFKSPDRKDPTELIKGAAILGTAAYGVRHHDAMAARYEEVAQGREVVSDASISPGWNNGGGYMARSALRRKP
jgi:hypothetical protein